MIKRLIFATKKNTDDIHTCWCDLHPNISSVNADSNQEMIDIAKSISEDTIRLEFQMMRSEHSGNKQRYHVKYCAVITLLNETNANVCKNKARVKSYGAMPKLENPNMNICGIVGI